MINSNSNQIMNLSNSSVHWIRKTGSPNQARYVWLEYLDHESPDFEEDDQMILPKIDAQKFHETSR